MNSDQPKELQDFSKLTIKIYNLNKIFLERLEYDLKSNGIMELTSMQALILKNIDESTGTITMMKQKGYSITKNPTHNLKYLANKGFIKKQISQYDSRCVNVSLTKKGEQAIAVINSSFMIQKEILTELVKDDNFIENTSKTIDKLLGVFDLNAQ